MKPMMRADLIDDSRIGQFKPSPFEKRERAATRKFKFKGCATRPEA
jgi:hypothetical protein